MELSKILPQYVELVALVYHEGSNVSRLFHLHAASVKTFRRVADLPPDPHQAWEKLIPLQQRLAAADKVGEVVDGFREDFGCSLDDLHTMFGNPAWKRAPQHGGPRWAAITKAVIDLGKAIEKSDDAAVERLLGEIPAMRHNTGSVEHSLQQLKARPK